MRKKHLLFDLDRTLWDFDSNAEIAFEQTFHHFGLQHLQKADYATFSAEYHRINSTLWEAYRDGAISKEILSIKRFSLTLEHFNTSPALIGRLSRELNDYYLDACAKQTRLMPGCIELLEYLQKKGYNMGIITNGFREAQIPKIKYAGLQPFFSNVFLSEDLGANKPNRLFFTKVLQKLHADPEECMVIGDDYEVDILGAYHIGIDQIYYNLHEEKHKTPSPTYEVSHLLEIKDIL